MDTETAKRTASDKHEFTDIFAKALTSGALPGELAGLDGEPLEKAAAFLAHTARRRQPGRAAIAVQTIAGNVGGSRLMRIAVVNDDMPFLVDSVSAALAAQGVEVRRLLHPVIAVRRDEDGTLTAVLPQGSTGERRESFIYLEAERVDARERQALAQAIDAVLEDVRAAVRDWQAMQIAMRDDAEGLPDGEGAALLRWLLDQNLTLLGHHVAMVKGEPRDRLGILRVGSRKLWRDSTAKAAIAWFEKGGAAPLLLKSDCRSTVHRRAPLDLIVTPVRQGKDVTGLSIHAGLWTSAALRTPAEDIPVLRSRLAAIEERLGFDPKGHAGKALHHALSELPPDLVLALPIDSLEKVVLTAMSLVDRPRPRLELVRTTLGEHLVAIVWLPRELLTTGRRVAIGDMLAQASGATLSNWSLQLGEGDIAQIRYMLDLPAGGAVPDSEPLDRRLSEMLRGWEPAVEAQLAEMDAGNRAVRLTLDYAAAFPIAYRTHSTPAEAATDILRLNALGGSAARGCRLYREEHDPDHRLRLKIYRRGALIPLSEAVPVLENFGFRVIEEIPTPLDGGAIGYIHEFKLDLPDADTANRLIEHSAVAEESIAATLEGRAENDLFNELIVTVGLSPDEALLFRAWFRYLRQTGFAYGLATAVEALKKAPDVARGIIAYFRALHHPTRGDAAEAERLHAEIETGLKKVTAIDDDRMLRRFRAVVRATLRTNAFSPAAKEALAFKIDSSGVPGLPAPVPWREIWVYSPRVEGIHLRGGPIARGGLRWSDRRDDFRTEILGLMKAQVVKNAVIVPTGAKGGFYPKQLPSPSDRDAWLAEGTESYRVFIRSLLSVTDNIVEGKVVHPPKVAIRDGDDPYFVVAADKGTATFSDVANAIAVERGFWLGDAFASGGSHGYDHKAMGITARGAWVSVQRHFAEMGVDVQTDPVRVVGCGDMSGDVFGNGMLLSKSIRLIAAFDHRHIFLDPDPDAAKSWEERNRLFVLPRSSWADYDAKLISKGGGVFPRDQKEIPISPQVREALGIADEVLDPSALIAAILKSPVDLLWFGGIGTYVKAKSETNAEVGDRSNEAHRVDGEEVRARVIGEGANLGVTQAGRIAFAMKGGRINADFIDNSAGVDCSDNEVNIKIALNREMLEGRLEFDKRNALLVKMTDDVAHIVLEDNRLQTLALSLAERGGSEALPAQLRVIEILEENGRINRAVDGFDSNDMLLRRAQEHLGLTRPELAVVLSHGKLALQDAIENSDRTGDPMLTPLLLAAFPPAMQKGFADAIEAHRLRPQILATKMSNRVINRLGLVAPFEMAEEEGCSLAQVATAYFTVDALFGLEALFTRIEQTAIGEQARLTLLAALAEIARGHVADLLRCIAAETDIGTMVTMLKPGLARLDAARADLIRSEARQQSDQLRQRITAEGADPALIDAVVEIAEIDGAIGTAALASELSADEVDVTRAYVVLGEALGLDWAKAAAARFRSADAWERLLIAGLTREFGQVRLDFLARHGGKGPGEAVTAWLETHRDRAEQFRQTVGRARSAAAPTAAMLAQIAAQARSLLMR
ncbi:glutamate dehydrogenase [Sphingomonas histidinilytica]|uniref:Glutamate dehydrogenase (NAD) n=1 Tax=Rhizorhabdus histidinilytica TaxID=439228 RepID=A0A1T5CEA7_9SPHN|nr:NAD-glutamate dehydrogenase domain-containing protein [Rhizorhabdus histidinilytica]MBO9378272.1 glutamate dehydrogenase [Rhizorhabdus histidinilytica]SKB57671.1 glutamate dehydrogenase (NAD) [Rhizorhabdus histidinilytica]